jgi:hypothetical protein
MDLSLSNSLVGGGSMNPDGLSLDLQFAADKTLTARRGPTPVFSRGSSGTFVNANGLIVGKTTGTTSSITPSTQAIGSQVNVSVPSGSVAGWVVGQPISLIVDTDGQDDPDATELWLLGNITGTLGGILTFEVTARTGQAGTGTSWTLGYRGPRFDHDPITLACKGLLIEEGRTNFCLSSEQFDDASYVKSACTISANAGASPAGDITADDLVEDTSTGFHGMYQTITTVVGTVYTWSFFVKANGRNFALIYSGAGGGASGRYISIPADGSGTVLGNYNANNAVVSMQYFGNGWYRVSQVFTASATSTGIDLYASINGTTLSYAGSGNSSILLWGAQLEAGAFATSYIPTTTASVARSADFCSITSSAFNSFYNQTEGTLFADVTPQTTDQLAAVFTVNTSTFNNTNGIYKSDSIASSLGKRWVGLTNLVGNNPQATISTSTDVAVSRSNLAYAYKLNDFAFAYAGTIVGTDASGTLPPSTSMYIGNREGSIHINGHLASVRYYRKRLPNAKLQTLTV